MSELTPTQWWDSVKGRHLASSPATAASFPVRMGGFAFCGSCAAYGTNALTPARSWIQYTIVGAWGLNEAEARAKMNNEPGVVSYTLQHGGETHTFLWKDE